MKQERLLKPSFADYTGQTSGENALLINNMAVGKWHEMPVTEKHSRLSDNETDLCIPIIPGKDIILLIAYNGTLEFQEKIRVGKNYPETNPFFNSLTLQKTSPEYRFVIHYKEMNDGLPPERTPLGYSKYSKHIKAAYNFLTPQSKKELQPIISEMEKEKTLESISTFLKESMPLLMESSWVSGRNLRKVVKEYNNTKILLGEEEGLATLITAIFSANMIPARKVRGITTTSFSKEEYKSVLEKRKKQLEEKMSVPGLPEDIKESFSRQINGLNGFEYKIDNGFLKETTHPHIWNEVFIPVNKMIGYWSLFDYSKGLIGRYTDGPEYAITTQLPLMKGDNKARIKLEYS